MLLVRCSSHVHYRTQTHFGFLVVIPLWSLFSVIELIFLFLFKSHFCFSSTQNNNNNEKIDYIFLVQDSDGIVEIQLLFNWVPSKFVTHSHKVKRSLNSKIISIMFVGIRVVPFISIKPRTSRQFEINSYDVHLTRF